MIGTIFSDVQETVFFDQGDVTLEYLRILPISRCGRSSLMPEHFPLKLDSCYRLVNMVLIFHYYVFK